MIADDSPLISDEIGPLEEDGIEINCSLFKGEVERARKHLIDNRAVCLLDWQVRDDARELLEKLCHTIREIIKGNNVQSASKEAKAQRSGTLVEQAKIYFELIEGQR